MLYKHYAYTIILQILMLEDISKGEKTPIEQSHQTSHGGTARRLRESEDENIAMWLLLP